MRSRKLLATENIQAVRGSQFSSRRDDDRCDQQLGTCTWKINVNSNQKSRGMQSNDARHFIILLLHAITHNQIIFSDAENVYEVEPS